MRHTRTVLAALAAPAALALAVTACGPASAHAAPPGKAATWAPPPANGVFDYQIGGAYQPAANVQVVDRDHGDAPAAGRYDICYVNAFQSQPEDASFWKTQHPDLLLHKANGSYFTDPDWPGEIFLDTSTAAKRTGILGVVGPWLDGCASSGYQAVEPDNLDTWTRSKGLLTKAENVALAQLLAQRAHADGLAIAQKNDPELTAADRSSVGFDFAIAEECQVYNECGSYTNTYGTHLIEIEYTDNGKSAYTKACSLRGATTSVILRDRDVVPAGQKAYHYEAC